MFSIRSSWEVFKLVKIRLKRKTRNESASDNRQTAIAYKSSVKSNWIIRFTHKHCIAFCEFYFNSFSVVFFNRYFHLQRYILASAVSITMASPYIFHTCPIPSWNMHVMSRSSCIIELDALCSYSCTLPRNGLCWAKFHWYQVLKCNWNSCLIIRVLQEGI